MCTSSPLHSKTFEWNDRHVYPRTVVSMRKHFQNTTQCVDLEQNRHYHHFIEYHYLVEHLLFWSVITIASYYNRATLGDALSSSVVLSPETRRQYPVNRIRISGYITCKTFIYKQAGQKVYKLKIKYCISCFY